MKRIAFDTHIVDQIAATPGMLEALQDANRGGALVLITSHIQSDELSDIADSERRGKLLAIYDALPTEWAATHGFVIGYSRLDMARIGDGSWTGVGVDDLDSVDSKHRRDALIGTTAAAEADVLVTNDGRLTRRMRAANAPCDVWNFEQFRDFVLSLKVDAGSALNADHRPSPGASRPTK